ncbi:hypothetical protein UFOVP412_52 [uncultured Caudovirales phage]|uniref:Uncharacterized protein n=1 Tax=uncultured Caudovirales phage TaxID=2100421 RepID=A0A6J5M7R7_9CAUD|nr:hypothetical protein UFOVP412_52 [uncultured Caudovirales phage]
MKRVTKVEIAKIRELYPEFSQADIAEQLGISRQQVHYHLSVAGLIVPGMRPQRDPETGLFTKQIEKADIEFRRQMNPIMQKYQSISLRPHNAEQQPVEVQRDDPEGHQSAHQGVFRALRQDHDSDSRGDCAEENRPAAVRHQSEKEAE